MHAVWQQPRVSGSKRAAMNVGGVIPILCAPNDLLAPMDTASTFSEIKALQTRFDALRGYL
ncbi:MAG: hypothetical protein L0H29_03195 [Sinobacteraceae bacterium]|nr:hypothetical protein [Nevskiaceae bacterium]